MNACGRLAQHLTIEAHRDLAARLADGVGGIGAEIEEHLMNLGRVGLHGADLRLDLGADFDRHRY